MKKLYIDMGGTHLRSELHSEEGILHGKVASQGTGLLGYIETKVREHPEIGFIGIAYAGQVHEGVILSAPNIDAEENAIKEYVESRYGIRLEIDNDLKCAVTAEASYWRTPNIAALYVGTGIGAAFVESGRVVRGDRNLAFEIGHIPYRSAPFRCGCGRQNCVELFASGSGMAKWLHHFGSDRPAELQRFRDSEAAHEQRIASQFEEALLHAVGTLVTVANPEILVFGGGIMQQNPYLLEMLKTGIGAFALKPSLERVRIEMSRLKNAPLQGAKLLEERSHG